jgi:hypothetical protein
MIGYSDSNKDVGFVAANWALYEAQRKLRDCGIAHGITMRLFHGRGGFYSARVARLLTKPSWHSLQAVWIAKSKLLSRVK